MRLGEWKPSPSSHFICGLIMTSITAVQLGEDETQRGNPRNPHYILLNELATLLITI